jgi:hypothetical protein
MPRCLPSEQVVCLILATVSLNVASAFLPNYPSSSHHATLASGQLQLDDSPLGGVVSTASEGRNLWDIRQQGKQALASVRPYDVYPVAPKDNRLRSTCVFIVSPVCFFFPRKLSPPSASDDLFLS